MIQQSLFDRAHARARRTDPQSSHAAAFHVEQSGKAGKQRIQAGAAVLAHPGCTSAELADRTGLDRYMLARRLPELRDDGLVRQSGSKHLCRMTGRLAVTWWPI